MNETRFPSLTLTMEQINEFNLCIGCGACTGICPYRKMNKIKAVSLFLCDNNAKRCLEFCPKTEPDNSKIYKENVNGQPDIKPIGNLTNIYKARAGKKFNKIFQNKKTITAISLFFIKKDITKKILMNKPDKNFFSKPFFAKTKEEIIKSSTHYSTGSSLNLIHSAKEKNYAFIGTPCQIQSIFKMKSAKKELRPDYLPDISIGLFCSWGLNPEMYSTYLKNIIKKDKIISSYITSGKKQNLILKTKKGEKIVKDINEIKPFIRNGCTTCGDLTSELADISVGDFEPDKKFNTLISRTKDSDDLIKKAEKKGYLELHDYSNKDLSSLEKASLNKKETAKANFLNILNQI